METVLKYLSLVMDIRQEKKVMHKMSDIIALVFFAMLSNADGWEEVEIFGKEHAEFLRRYLGLPNGIPSHDTIQRVFAVVPPEFLQKFQILWNEMLNSNEGKKIKKILAIDGKTQRGNGNKNQKANHIVSAVDENGLCLGEKRGRVGVSLTRYAPPRSGRAQFGHPAPYKANYSTTITGIRSHIFSLSPTGILLVALHTLSMYNSSSGFFDSASRRDFYILFGETFLCSLNYLLYHNNENIQLGCCSVS